MQSLEQQLPSTSAPVAAASEWLARRPTTDLAAPGLKRQRVSRDAERTETTAVLLPATIEPATLTSEQRAAAARAMQGENLFITGAAGNGKSFLLRYLIQELEKRFPGEVAITAPTGLAAINIGGQTLHSFAGVGLWEPSKLKRPERYLLSKVRSSETTASRWRSTKVLVVDEVSMLEPTFFEQLDFVAREIRGNRSSGFGGMQMLMCGDFLQLPPVDASRDAEARWNFCFEAPAWKRCNLTKGTIVLRQTIRQCGDPSFVGLLSEVRAGRCTAAVIEACSRVHVAVKPLPDDGIMPTRLYCTNRDVDNENQRELARLPGELRIYRGQDTMSRKTGGAAAARATTEKKRLSDLLDKKVPLDLHLKVGAQVILLKKIHGPAGAALVNGSRGVVTLLHEGAVTVRFDCGPVRVEPHQFSQAGSAAVCYRRQLPMKLGWALTIHKSQGMTLTRAEVHLDDCFSCGQAYVALSRLTGFKGLWICGRGRGITPQSIRAHPAALQFYQMLS